MTMFLVNLVDGVFRPSVAALAIVAGIIAFSTELTSGPTSLQGTTPSEAFCSGLFQPICNAFTF